MSGDAGALLECEVKILISPDHTAFQVRSSGQGRARIGRALHRVEPELVTLCVGSSQNWSRSA